MPSTWTLNNAIEKIADGEKTDTWGQITNRNFDILDRAASGVGTIDLSSSAAAHTLYTTDGTVGDALTDGMYKVLVLSGATEACTITISPNDADKLYFVDNNSGYDCTFSQGSGANVTIANGKGAIIFADGAGSGAAVTDLTALFVNSQAIDGAVIGGTTPAAITGTTITATTSILPDTSGGADIGSTSAEFGDIYIADDKKIKFGSDQDISVEYDEDGTDSLLISGGDVTIADDKKLFFGTDKDVSIEYDEDGNNTMLVTGDVVFADGSTSVDIKSHDLSANGLKLDGTLVTASAAELNHCDGVTSNIQTQLNTKVTSSGVTSVATGTGLTGGTITSTGTISINTGLGDVGTYAFLCIQADTTIVAGQTYTRSSSGADNNNQNLFYSGLLMDAGNNFDDDTALDATGSVTTGLTGIWRAMGEANHTNRRAATLFLRIS